MLRNRSSTRAAVTSKQPNLMGSEQYNSSQSPSTNTNTIEDQKSRTKPVQSFLVSPKFKAFTTFKPETESPTSILDSSKLLLSPLKNPFWFDHTNRPGSPKPLIESSSHHPQYSWKELGSKGIGVALIDDGNSNGLQSHKENSEANNRMVLFATKLRVQIPPLQNPTDPLRSPSDFGTKTKNSPSRIEAMTIKETPRTMGEMEMSEEYTCVTSHGPNRRTIHIFDNCIVMDGYSTSLKPVKPIDNNYNYSASSPNSFLKFCQTCHKNLEQKNDIYIYRGEKAFCSRECRYQEVQLYGEEN